MELARHNDRPHTLDYIKNISQDWIELHGDRKYSDDPSIVCGLALIENQSFILNLSLRDT